MPKRLLTDKQVAYIEDGTAAINPKNAWNYDQTIRENLNAGVPQLFSLFPELVPYLDTDHLQSTVDGFDLGWTLGQLLTVEQRRQVAATLVWGEQLPDESDQAFLNRLPDLIETFGSTIEQMADRARYADQGLDFLRSLDTHLRETFQQQLEQRLDTAGISMAVPAERVIEWAKGQSEPSTVPELLSELYAGWDEGVHGKVTACRSILLSAGRRLDVASERPGEVDTVANKWALHYPPLESDIDQYLAVIDALDDEIRALVDQYITEERIGAKDRLLDEGVAILEGLSKPGRDILTWDDRHTTRSDWMGHHTRAANVWSDDLPLPILEPISESRHRQEWELTGFGEFVVELYEEGIDRNEVDQNGFPTTVSDEVLERALKEVSNAETRGQ